MPFKDGIYELNGEDLTIPILNKIVDEGSKIGLSPQTWEKVVKSRNAVLKMMSQPNKIVYGINTGFGNFADKIISPDQRHLLQTNLIRSHAVGMGKPLKNQFVKKMIILRINTLCKGRSGISKQNLSRYVQAYNKNYLPLIPEKGTVGASGDLAPLSHLALGMMGQGQVWDDQTQKFDDAQKIMKKKQLTPILLEEKQGLALINGTQFMSSIISSIQFKVQKLLESALIVFSYAFQIFGLETEVFLKDQVISYYEQKNKSISLFLKKARSYLGNQPSELNLYRRENSYKNNRCSSMMKALQNFSAVFDSLQLCKKLINEQLNSATDNPLVFLKEDGFQEDQLISAGNFHGQYVAKASDFISMALFSMGRFSEARIQRIVNDRISNLPGFLTVKGGINSGFMIVQYTAAALLSESKVLAKPASTDSISTSASQEDHVSMGGYAARKCEELYENISSIIGIQLLHYLQAVDMIDKKPSAKLQKIHKKVRQYVPFFKQDSYFAPSMQICKQLVQKRLLEFAQ